MALTPRPIQSPSAMMHTWRPLGARLWRATIALLAAWLLQFVAGEAAQQSPTPIGVWEESSQRIQVEVAPCGDRLCGRLVWFRWPRDAAGLPLVDLKNPDPQLRSRPLLGLTILQGLRQTGERTWSDGQIYNPNDGVTYKVRMSMLEDGSVRMRAYVLLPILGKNFVWTRAPVERAAEEPSPSRPCKKRPRRALRDFD